MGHCRNRTKTLDLGKAGGEPASLPLPDTMAGLERLDEIARQLVRHGLLDVGGDIKAIATGLRMDLRGYLTWMPEAEAAIYTGHAEAWLRSRFRGMELSGQARERQGKREYRRIALLAKRDDLLRAEGRARAAARLGLEREKAA